MNPDVSHPESVTPLGARGTSALLPSAQAAHTKSEDRPAPEPLSTLDALLIPAGVKGTFLERRFFDDPRADVDALVARDVIAFLSVAHHEDALYQLRSGAHGLGEGLYRIRDEGAEVPLVTLKRQGDGHGSHSETIDVVHPTNDLLKMIRREGELIAVIEKTRRTYISLHHANCLVHFDAVLGIGETIDVKAGSPRDMELFLEELLLGSRTELGKSYLEMKQEKGISPLHLRAWKIHEACADYVMGVVSGTLTPLGFLSAAAVAGASQESMIVTLLTVGVCDGLSDAVGAAQSTQSEAHASWLTQVSMFAKTIVGKIAVPCTFVPTVLLADGPMQTCVAASTWAAAVLTTTATMQALAHAQKVLPAALRLLGFGGGSVALGVLLGNYLPPLIRGLIGN